MRFRTRKTRRKVESTLERTFLRAFAGNGVLGVVEVDQDVVAVNFLQAGIFNDVGAQWSPDLRKAVQQMDVVMNLQLFTQERQRAGGAGATLTELLQLFVIVSELLRRANVGLEKARLPFRD